MVWIHGIGWFFLSDQSCWNGWRKRSGPSAPNGPTGPSFQNVQKLGQKKITSPTSQTPSNFSKSSFLNYPATHSQSSRYQFSILKCNWFVCRLFCSFNQKTKLMPSICTLQWIYTAYATQAFSPRKHTHSLSLNCRIK